MFDLGTSIATLDRKVPMDWKYIATGIGVDEADRRLKEAGYRGTYGAVEISQTRGVGIIYCFESVALEGGGFESVILGVFEGDPRDVSRTGGLLCP